MGAFMRVVTDGHLTRNIGGFNCNSTDGKCRFLNIKQFILALK